MLSNGYPQKFPKDLLLNKFKENEKMAAKVDKDTCAGCGACVDACPCSAIKLDGDKANVDPDTCAGCGACVDTCPCSAITLE